MKFLHLVYHFEYTPTIEDILDDHQVEQYVRYSMMEGKDRDGKHFGSQVHPGNTSVVQARLADDQVEPLLEDLREFKHEKESHEHLEAMILPVEDYLE